MDNNQTYNFIIKKFFLGYYIEFLKIAELLLALESCRIKRK